MLDDALFTLHTFEFWIRLPDAYELPLVGIHAFNDHILDERDQIMAEQFNRPSAPALSLLST
jgi:hypothetical protein